MTGANSLSVASNFPNTENSAPANPVTLPPGCAKVERDVVAVDPAQFRHLPQERSDSTLPLLVIFPDADLEHSHPSHPASLLRARCEWPRECCAADRGNELAWPHGLPPRSRIAR